MSKGHFSKNKKGCLQTDAGRKMKACRKRGTDLENEILYDDWNGHSVTYKERNRWEAGLSARRDDKTAADML